MKTARARHGGIATSGLRLLIAAVALVFALPRPPASAQELEEISEEQALPQFKLIGEGGFTYEGDADIDGGGRSTATTPP